MIRDSVFDREQPDDCAACGQHGVDAAAGVGGQTGRAICAEVGHVDELVSGERPLQRRGKLGGAEPRRHRHAFAAKNLPMRIGVVEKQDRDRGEVDQAAQAGDGGVEHLAHVERRGERLRDTVQREQQCVRVGEPRETVECERALPVGLAGDATGVPRDHRDEQHDDGPLHSDPDLVLAVTRLECERDTYRERGGDADPQRKRVPAGEAGHDDRRGEREHERRSPESGRGHCRDVNGHLGENHCEALDVAEVSNRAHGAEHGVADEDDAPSDDPPVGLREGLAGERDRDHRRAPANRQQRGAEGSYPVDLVEDGEDVVGVVPVARPADAREWLQPRRPAVRRVTRSGQHR